MSTSTPAIGDLDDDGLLDIVFGTTTGHIWALRGTNGKVLNHFPFRTGKRIVAPVVISNLKNISTIKYEKENKLLQSVHIIVPSLDGYLYIIDSLSGCTNKVDISEHIYSMVLVDDLNNDGRIDLLFGTMNGNIYSIKTEGAYHPLKLSQQIGLGKNHFTYQHGYHGIYFTKETVTLNQVLGQYVKLSFEIVDRRRSYLDEKDAVGKSLPLVKKSSYKISIYVGSRSTITNMSNNNKLKLLKTYYRPNQIYTEYIDMEDVKENEVAIYIRMVNEHGEIFFDSIKLKYYNINLLHHNAEGDNSTMSFSIFVIFVVLQLYFTCFFSSLNSSNMKIAKPKSK